MYCVNCGKELTTKYLVNEGNIPYCASCDKLFFPMFNSAVSMVVLNAKQDKILLIQQYAKTDNILVAGYINKGENATEALKRELKEETNLEVVSYLYNDNRYYAPSNTLIHNYIVVVKDDNFKLTDEVDKAEWFTFSKAKASIKPNSLAETFLLLALDKILEHKE